MLFIGTGTQAQGRFQSHPGGHPLGRAAEAEEPGHQGQSLPHGAAIEQAGRQGPPRRHPGAAHPTVPPGEGQFQSIVRQGRSHARLPGSEYRGACMLPARAVGTNGQALNRP